jgi:hypothetical protein
MFGNFSEKRSKVIELSAELHALRLAIAKGQDQFRKTQGQELLWWGIPYT